MARAQEWASNARAELAQSGSGLPACSATMYSAYQSGQFSSRWPPLRFSCSPWATAARRIAAARSGCGSVVRGVGVDPAGEPGGDLLQQPFVAVRILEGRVGGIALPLRMPAADRRLAGTGAVEHFAHFDAVADEFGARRLDVRHDKIKPACRAGRGRRDAGAEMDRGRRARRRELHRPERVADDEIAVEPPAQAFVKLLGACGVRNGDDDGLELHVERLRSWGFRSLRFALFVHVDLFMV